MRSPPHVTALGTRLGSRAHYTGSAGGDSVTPDETFRFQLEDGSGAIKLEDDSGFIEREHGSRVIEDPLDLGADLLFFFEVGRSAQVLSGSNYVSLNDLGPQGAHIASVSGTPRYHATNGPNGKGQIYAPGADSRLYGLCDVPEDEHTFFAVVYGQTATNSRCCSIATDANLTGFRTGAGCLTNGVRSYTSNNDPGGGGTLSHAAAAGWHVLEIQFRGVGLIPIVRLAGVDVTSDAGHTGPNVATQYVGFGSGQASADFRAHMWLGGLMTESDRDGVRAYITAQTGLAA